MEDWRYLTCFSVICWGLWGFLSKLIGSRLDWGTVFALFSVGTVLVILLVTPSSFVVRFGSATALGMAAGIFGAMGFVFFYKALSTGPASSVIPLSSMYIVLAVVLAFIFINEPVTIKKVIGIISAITAIILLS